MSLTMAQVLKWLMDPRAVVALLMFFVVYLLKQWMSGGSEADTDSRDLAHPRLSWSISRTWDDRPVDHDPVQLTLLPHSDAGLKILVQAPFFNDPPNPGGDPGKSFPGLWDHEVVEFFFLNDENEYLEVELCPHGQHLVLLLRDYRKPFKDGLPLEFRASIEGSTWRGEATIPAIYFPVGVTKLNAYAIHGSGDHRVYEALYAAPTGKFKDPDFHRLEYFQAADIQQLLPSNAASRYHSSLWEQTL